VKTATGVCDGWGTHQNKNKQKYKHLHLQGGAYWKPYSTGYGFLAYGVRRGEVCVKNKLDFLGQPCRVN
jgi:hypothetical protein